MPKLSLIALLCALTTGTATLSAQTKLLRFPDIHDSRIVVHVRRRSVVGPPRAVRRRASRPIQAWNYSPGFPPMASGSLSPGQYDGDEQVYVIPPRGGEPRQLTYYPARGPLAPRWGYDNQVYGWSNDGKLRDLPVVARWLGAGSEPAVRFRGWRAGRAAAHAEWPVPDRSPRRATRSSTRRRRATSAPKSATAAARPTSSNFRRRDPCGQEDLRKAARQPRSDVDRQADLFQLRPRRPFQPVRLRRRPAARPPR